MEQHKKRSKECVSVDDVREILRKSGYSNGIVRSQFSGMDDETFCIKHEYLMRKILQATPRLNAPTVQSAVRQEFGKGVDGRINRDFAEAIVDAFRFVHTKRSKTTTCTRTTEFMKGFLKAVWPPPEEDVAELVPIVDRSSSSCSANPFAAIMDVEPSAPSSSCSALVPFASPSKVAKQGGDPMSPGSVLALYGIDRTQVRTLVRKVSDTAVSISDDSQGEATASDAVSTIHQVRVWYGSPHSITPHGFQNRNCETILCIAPRSPYAHPHGRASPIYYVFSCWGSLSMHAHPLDKGS